jgi:ubiquinone/menaquinone biosynthesis C-methylase UbiE
MTADRKFRPGSINYDDVAPTYSAARAFSSETAETWTNVIRPFLPKVVPAIVLDAGCGTGRFASLISERPDVHVIAIDLSPRMLAQAIQVDRPNLSCAVASVEAVPLSDGSCGMVWMSQVIHHVVDRTACARELRRVIRPDGHLLIRGAFGDRLDACPTYFRFFPGARRITSQLPTLRDVIATFRQAGFAISGFQSIPQQTCASLRELAERTRQRADSTLRMLSDAEYEASQCALEKAAAEERYPESVIEAIDVLIMKPNA